MTSQWPPPPTRKEWICLTTLALGVVVFFVAFSVAMMAKNQRARDCRASCEPHPSSYSDTAGCYCDARMTRPDTP